jgi:hypothetical protein
MSLVTPYVDEKTQKLHILRSLIMNYYAVEGHGTGGSLHIVLDDHNYERTHIKFCLDEAKKCKDLMGIEIATRMLEFSDEENKVLVETGWEIDELIGSSYKAAYIMAYKK